MHKPGRSQGQISIYSFSAGSMSPLGSEIIFPYLHPWIFCILDHCFTHNAQATFLETTEMSFCPCNVLSL